jgi:peptidoglycan/LPS O-acetylase OafA/YrhL
MALTERPAASTTVESRFPCFDGLRALAALAVLMTHVSFAGGANAPNVFGIFFARMDGGVAVFFVLSGVLIYRPFARAHVFAESGPALRSYLWRRAIRIYPAYWLAMTVIVYVFGATQIPGVRNFLLDYSLLNIYSPHQPDAFGPLLQSWTLSTELTFYAFVPLWALVLRRVARGDVRSRIRAQLTGVLVLIGVSALWKGFVLSAGFDDARIGQLKLWLPWWLDLFAIGMGLAVLSLAVTHRSGSTAASRRSRAGSARSARCGGSRPVPGWATPPRRSHTICCGASTTSTARSRCCSCSPPSSARRIAARAGSARSCRRASWCSSA